MTTEDIFKTMQDLIAEQFAIDADEITMDSSFVDDLGADSVDLVELVMAMEEEFDIGEIEEEDLTGLKTVGDCVKYLTKKETPLSDRRRGFLFQLLERGAYEKKCIRWKNG